MFGIEDADTVGARALHQVDGHTRAFLLAYTHRSLLASKSGRILVLNLGLGAIKESCGSQQLARLLHPEVQS